VIIKNTKVIRKGNFFSSKDSEELTLNVFILIQMVLTLSDIRFYSYLIMSNIKDTYDF